MLRVLIGSRGELLKGTKREEQKGTGRNFCRTKSECWTVPINVTCAHWKSGRVTKNSQPIFGHRLANILIREKKVESKINGSSAVYFGNKEISLPHLCPSIGWKCFLSGRPDKNEVK